MSHISYFRNAASKLILFEFVSLLAACFLEAYKVLSQRKARYAMFKICLNQNCIKLHQIVMNQFRKANKNDFITRDNSTRQVMIKSNASFKVNQNLNFVKVRYSSLIALNNSSLILLTQELAKQNFIIEQKTVKNEFDLVYSFIFKVKI